MKKVWKYLGYTGFVAIVLFLILLIYGFTVPNRWYMLRVIYGNSMSPTIRAGDIALYTPLNTEPKVDDIVAFKAPDGTVLTHRIVGIVNGIITTKGDACGAEDSFRDKSGTVLLMKKVSFLYRGRIPLLGWPIGFVRQFLSGAWLVDTETSTGLIEAAVLESGYPTATPTSTAGPEEVSVLEPTETPTETPTPETSETATATPTETATPEPTPTETPTSTPTATPEESVLDPTPTPTPTETGGDPASRIWPK